jgi:hypothetical protein
MDMQSELKNTENDLFYEEVSPCKNLMPFSLLPHAHDGRVGLLASDFKPGHQQ